MQISEALSSWNVETWSLKRYLHLPKYVCKVTPLLPSHLLTSLLKEKNSRVDVKATGCHFPLNSTKHMGAGLHLSQIVKIFFFKKPKSSRDGSKCAWFPWAVSSATFTLADIFINTHMARQDLIGCWSSEPETELWCITYMQFHFFFLIKVTDLPSSFHVQSPNLSVLIDSCNLLTQAVKAERLGMSWCFLWGRHMIIALSPGESMRLVKMDSHQGRKREPNALIWRSVGKTWNVTRILVYFRHLENFKNKHL